MEYLFATGVWQRVRERCNCLRFNGGDAFEVHHIRTDWIGKDIPYRFGIADDQGGVAAEFVEILIDGTP